MKEILKAIKGVLMANWPALIAVIVLSIILQIQYDFNFILSLIILLVIYFVLGCLIEYIIQSYKHYKKTKRGKTDEQLKREAEIRERRRTRGMEMMNEENVRRNSVVETSAEPPAYVRRRPVYSHATEARSVKPVAQSEERRESIVSSYRKRRTPFDVEPPSETMDEKVSNKTAEEISDNASADDTVNYVENIEVNENKAVSETVEKYEEVDDVYVNTDDLDELYSGNENFADDTKNKDSVNENAADVSEASSEKENDTENDVKTDYKPMSVSEIQRTSSDISKEIKDRVNTHRRRTHVIFDAYDTGDTNDTDTLSDAAEDSAAAEDDFEVDSAENIPADDIDISTDAVDANQDKLDELYGEKSGENKNKKGFFSRAISGFKKKRRDRKNRKKGDSD